ncbi:unnamed protein product [Victoria cruziana]
MGSRKLVRDFLLSQQTLFLRRHASQAPRCSIEAVRRFSVFNEFSEKVKGEAKGNQDFQESLKEFKEKADELKGVREDLKARTKQTAEQLYKRVDGAWTEAEATAKKVSANVKEKISAAKEEVKETFGLGKEDAKTSTSNESNASMNNNDSGAFGDGKGSFEGSSSQGQTSASDTFFHRIKSNVSSASPKVKAAFEKLKDNKIMDLAKKGYDIVKDELNGSTNKRKWMQQAAASSSNVKRSDVTDIVAVPVKQSRWSKKWEEFKNKVQKHPAFKQVSGFSEPVVAKSQEIAEDMRERWETSDNPVVHKIQDLNETVFGETAAAISFKEIKRRDPTFSLPDFVAEVQEMVRPTLQAYLKGDAEALKKTCAPEVIERCKAERMAYESQGIFFDNKILHISEVEVRETKLMGTTPIIVLAFQTQQIYCVRDRHGAVTEGGKDTIHTVFYAWAMQQVDAEELGENVFYPVWRLREMQQLGIQALI